MKLLTVNMWESDNIESDIEISDDFYRQILNKFHDYCEECDDLEEEFDEVVADRDAWEAFFDDVELSDINEEEAKKVEAIVADEIKGSIRMNWDDPSDPDGWQKEFEDCVWGFFPVIIYEVDD